MIGLRLDPRLRHVLAIGAHADDLEIGAFGLLDGLLGQAGLTLTWVVLSGSAERAAEGRRSVERLVAGRVRVNVEQLDFRERYFPHLPELKEYFDDLSGRVRPDLVVTPRLEDRHQDHRTAAELTWQAFRNVLVLEYEIAKYEGDLGNPNVFIPLTRADVDRKVEHLLESFPSQQARGWFGAETFEGLMRMRGIECAAPGGYAEGFTARKAILDPSVGDPPPT